MKRTLFSLPLLFACSSSDPASPIVTGGVPSDGGATFLDGATDATSTNPANDASANDGSQGDASTTCTTRGADGGTPLTPPGALVTAMNAATPGDVVSLSGMDESASYIAWQNGIVTKDEHANAMLVESPICHPSVTMRRSALEAAGGYHDPSWPEDWDLWLRIVEQGFGIAKVPEVLLRWRRHAASLTVTDARCSEERMRECRAHYLARRLGDRPFAIWGAGQTGRRLARALEPHAKRPRLFVDIDRKKQRARDLAVIRPEALDRDLFVIVAVGAPGARDVVRGRLIAAGRREGDEFFCAA